ncbi:MAG: hypothetical protein IIA92_05315 [Chloroflexi bacterium]|nr:hypothetical protein [Chloroflexota bacterium]
MVQPKPIKAKASVVSPSIWQSANFAESWYRDALKESVAGGADARRREILFATCFLESYIFEWARRNLQIEEVNNFLISKPRRMRSLLTKWKKIPQELFEADKLNTKPVLDVSGLDDLIKHRNGLVHAHASRPANPSQAAETMPFPTINELEHREPGWACKIAVELISELHRQIGTAVPDYLEMPSAC